MTNEAGNERFKIIAYYNGQTLVSNSWTPSFQDTTLNFNNYGITGYVKVTPDVGYVNTNERMSVTIYSTEGLTLAKWTWILTTTNSSKSVDVDKKVIKLDGINYFPQ